jgi:hypothetical protein
MTVLSNVLAQDQALNLTGRYCRGKCGKTFILFFDITFHIILPETHANIISLQTPEVMI